MVRPCVPHLRSCALALAVLTTATGGGEAAAPRSAAHLPTTHLPTTAPPPALSSVVLPVSVPLAGLQAAAEARVPQLLASLDQEYSALGGLLRAQLSGEVRRSGPLTLTPAEDGGSVLVQLPVTVHLHVAPGGVGEVLTRDFSGSAVVTARLTPTVTPEWQTRVAVSADYRWTDPLSFDIVSGVRVNVQTLVDPQLRAQLTRLGDTLAASLAQSLDLRAQAGSLWARLGMPWTLPLPPLGPSPGSGKPETAFATITPGSVSASALRFTPSEVRVVLGATFRASAGLLAGAAPAPLAALPLPPLGTLPDSVLSDPAGHVSLGHVSLQLPVLLPYAPLSRAASALAARQDYPLPLPLSPRLHVQDIVLEPAPAAGNAGSTATGSTSAGSGPRVRATVRLRVTALGLPLTATVDVTGAPQLQGTVLTLPDAEVHTRPQGLSGRLIGWLADARVQRLVRGQLRFDLAPALEDARAQLQARLPFAPAPGLTLAGQVRALRVTALQVRADGLLAAAAAEGGLLVTVRPEPR